MAAVFEGQLRADGMPEYALGTQLAVANRLDLGDDDILANLAKVQVENELPTDDALQFIEQSIETENGTEVVRFANFSVEMETGTGKTYIYLRTILDLNRRYGFRKFIIVVPSVAVREGVLKTVEITREHFAALYDKQPYRVYESVGELESGARVRAVEPDRDHGDDH